MNNYSESSENNIFTSESNQNLYSLHDEYNLSSTTTITQQGANLVEIDNLAENIAFFEQVSSINAEQETKLKEAKNIAQDILTQFATNEGFSDALTVAFGDSYNQAIADSIAQQWEGDNFGMFPEIEVLSSEDMGEANGAFAGSTGKIYLSEEFLLNNSLSDIASVILEEKGHYVDHQINITDAVGDEGEIFAHLVQGNVLSAAELTSLQSENDSGVINIGGVDVLVEQNLDLFAIKKYATGTNSTEVHKLSGANQYRNFSLHTGTAAGESGANVEFEMADWDRDGISDLVMIAKYGTGTRSTEVHILSGASNFQQFILHTGTALHETGSNFEFEMTDWNRDGRSDLVAIKKSETGTGTTEVHIYSGATNFQTALLHTGTGTGESGSNVQFEMADWNRDGVSDLVMIAKHGTGTRTTEVHILSGASNFQQFILHTGTGTGESGSNVEFEMADWNRDGFSDLVMIAKHGTGTRTTEVHVLSGASQFQQFILQTGTALHETGSNFVFLMDDESTSPISPTPSPSPSPSPTPSPSPSYPPIIDIKNAQYFKDRPQFYMQQGNHFAATGYGSSLLGTNRFGKEGNCTWYAYGRLKELGFTPEDILLPAGQRNANQWGSVLRNGAKIVNTPQAGDVAQWYRNGQNHVAIVEKVENGFVYLSESNWSTDKDGDKDGDGIRYGDGTFHHIVKYSINSAHRYIRLNRR